MTSQITGPCCDSDIEPDQYKSLNCMGKSCSPTNFRYLWRFLLSKETKSSLVSITYILKIINVCHDNVKHGELWSICPKVDKNFCWIHHWWFSQSTSPQSLKNNYFPRERGNPQPYLTPREAVFHMKGFLLILIWSFVTYNKIFLYLL